MGHAVTLAADSRLRSSFCNPLRVGLRVPWRTAGARRGATAAAWSRAARVRAGRGVRPDPELDQVGLSRWSQRTAGVGAERAPGQVDVQRVFEGATWLGGRCALVAGAELELAACRGGLRRLDRPSPGVAAPDAVSDDVCMPAVFSPARAAR